LDSFAVCHESRSHQLLTLRRRYCLSAGLWSKYRFGHDAMECWCISSRFFVARRAGLASRKTAQAGRALNQEDIRIAAKPIEDKVRVNERIHARQIRVIDDNGEQLGIMHPSDALRTAYDRGLDLVEVAPQAVPPVCRIMDYGKYKYQQSKRAKESKKHQHTVTLKEVKYRPKIDDHDFDYKTNHVREFLSEGNKVKVTIMFRGREMAHPEFGQEILARVIEAAKDLSQDHPDPSRSRLEGRNMSVVLSPSKTA
jgi:translation initiation factor IF-3